LGGEGGVVLRESGEGEEQDECRQDSLDHCCNVAFRRIRD
jgi:hypothetical protein